MILCIVYTYDFRTVYLQSFDLDDQICLTRSHGNVYGASVNIFYSLCRFSGKNRIYPYIINIWFCSDDVYQTHFEHYQTQRGNELDHMLEEMTQHAAKINNFADYDFNFVDRDIW